MFCEWASLTGCTNNVHNTFLSVQAADYTVSCIHDTLRALCLTHYTTMYAIRFAA